MAGERDFCDVSSCVMVPEILSVCNRDCSNDRNMVPGSHNKAPEDNFSKGHVCHKYMKVEILGEIVYVIYYHFYISLRGDVDLQYVFESVVPKA